MDCRTRPFVILVWAGALLIGVSLGLLGSGGSILTVPALVYLAGEDHKLAIAESLAIVGLIATSGAFTYARAKLVDWRCVLTFGVPGMLGTFLGAHVGGYLPGVVQLALFAGVMLAAALMMFRPARPEGASHTRSLTRIAVDGLAVGAITGLVGVGGGFLIIPALVLLGGLSMRLAVGTSLVIIALKSAVGFAEYFRTLSAQGVGVNWDVIALFAAVGIAGSVLGGFASRFCSQHLLRRAFAAFLVVLGSGILITSVPGAVQEWRSSPAAHAAQGGP